MFIELTDHLRCPAGHPEAYLVLIPDQMRGREVLRGTLGCPICFQEYPVLDGVLSLGAAPDLASPPAEAEVPTAEMLHTLLGLDGPGGFVALLGEPARQAEGLAALLPGVHLVLVNPPAPAPAAAMASVVLSPVVPLKQRSLRGLVLGRPLVDEAGWREAAAGAVLPGLRVVGQGPAPALAELELLASAGDWWVGKRL